MEAYRDDNIDDHLIRLAQKRGHRLFSPRTIGLRGEHDAVHFRQSVSRGLPLIVRALSRLEQAFPNLQDQLIVLNQWQ